MEHMGKGIAPYFTEMQVGEMLQSVGQGWWYTEVTN